jgi:phospholipase C
MKFQDHVALPVAGGDQAPILTDITNCNLQQVSWVIPDGNWSDHAGFSPGDGGPSWVAAIVNAIGGNPPCANNGNEVYWNDTVILITWDDWGGYYDDVVPPDCTTSPCTGYNGGGGNGQQYVYGFRVPLLVVGAYAKQGYISGGSVFPPNCAPPHYYCHDFGSILNFIEYAFGLGEISPNYHYADHFVMDTTLQHPYSLWDFFDFTQFHQFQPITPGAKYPPSCFHNPGGQGCGFLTYPLDPDNDANESD